MRELDEVASGEQVFARQPRRKGRSGETAACPERRGKAEPGVFGELQVLQRPQQRRKEGKGRERKAGRQGKQGQSSCKHHEDIELSPQKQYAAESVPTFIFPCPRSTCVIIILPLFFQLATFFP